MIVSRRLLNLILGGILLSFFLLQCKKDDAEGMQNQQNAEDSLYAAKKRDSLLQDSINKAKIVYQPFIFPEKKKDSAMAEFNKKYSDEEQYTILALNRLDNKNKWRADTLAIPDKMDHTLMSYSPFPFKVDALKDVHKIAFFSYPIQAFAIYDNGVLQKWGPTSMGKKSAQTKRGLMFGNWKKELAISTVESSWKLPYNFNIHNFLGIGWHQYDLPGFPASHSCLRLLEDDAKYLYNWGETWVLNKGGASVRANGTPVIVYGDYEWGGKKPWKNLIQDSKANDISVEEFTKIIEPHLEKILQEQKNTIEVRRELAQEKSVQKTAS